MKRSRVPRIIDSTDPPRREVSSVTPKGGQPGVVRGHPPTAVYHRLPPHSSSVRFPTQDVVLSLILRPRAEPGDKRSTRGQRVARGGGWDLDAHAENDAFRIVAVDAHLSDVVGLDQPKNEVIDDGRLIHVRPPGPGPYGQ